MNVPASTIPPGPSTPSRRPGALWLALDLPLALLAALRPKQWTKNVLVFAGIVFTYNLRNESMLATVAAAFVVFCALASAGYLFNDLLDLAADRLHPKKKLRPLASGRLPPGLARVAGAVLVVAALALAVSIGRSFALVAAVYLALSISYSLWLKHLVLLDVFGIAGGFVLRAVGGALAIGVPVSPWLYVCTILGSLFIALGKRRNELELLSDAAGHRRNLEHYSLELVDQLILIVASAMIMAYSLYTFSAENLPRDHSMMLTIPFVLYGVFRYLYLVRVRRQGGAPEDMLLADPGLLGTVLGWGVTTLAILYLAR